MKEIEECIEEIILKNVRDWNYYNDVEDVSHRDVSACIVNESDGHEQHTKLVEIVNTKLNIMKKDWTCKNIEQNHAALMQHSEDLMIENTSTKKKVTSIIKKFENKSKKLKTN